MGALGQGETGGDDSAALGGEKISGSNGRDRWIERSIHSPTGSGLDFKKGE